MIGGGFTNMANANQQDIASFSAIAGQHDGAEHQRCARRRPHRDLLARLRGQVRCRRADGYQWLRDGVAIAAATRSSYTVAPGDVGHALSCSVTASNLGGAANATSAAVTAVAPRVTGSTSSSRSSTGHPVPGFEADLLDGCLDERPDVRTGTPGGAQVEVIPGATASTYTVGIADEATGPSDDLTCAVIAHNDGGDSRAAVSRAVLVAVLGTLRCPRPTGRLARKHASGRCTSA